MKDRGGHAAVRVVRSGGLQGVGKPQLMIASDLPLQGAAAHRPCNLAAMPFVLERGSGSRPVPFKIGYQACDDSPAQTGGWDPAKSASNARTYATEKSLMGVLGTFNSGCAEIVSRCSTGHRWPARC